MRYLIAIYYIIWSEWISSYTVVKWQMDYTIIMNNIWYNKLYKHVSNVIMTWWTLYENILFLIINVNRIESTLH